MKYAKAKYGKKLVININFKGEVVEKFAPKQIDSTVADFEKKLKK